MTRIRDKAITQKGPFTQGFNSDFELLDFEGAIATKGYNVIWQRALMCSCKSIGNEHQSTCKNCGGSGWLFVNPTRTRAIITSIDVDRSYEADGRKDLGKVMITMSHDDKISHMDKIQIEESSSEHSEVLYLRENINGPGPFVFARYDIKSIYYVGLYRGDSSPLERLTEENGDFTFIDNKIIFNSIFEDGEKFGESSVSVRYEHSPVYHIWEITHDARDSLIKQGNQAIKLPVQGIGKRAHLIAELENFNGDRLFDNSFEDMCSTNSKITTTEKLERVIKYTPIQEIFDNLTDDQKEEMAKICQENDLPLQLPFKLI